MNTRNIDPDWKKKVGALLRDLGLVNEIFTGQIEFEVNAGEVTKAQRRVIYR